MDTKMEIKHEDFFSDDLASQNERELFHKVITVKSNSNTVLPDDSGYDMAIKTEIKLDTCFPDREYFTKHFVKQIEFEAVTCRNNSKIVTETKIEEQILDSDFGSQKEREFLTQGPVFKANYYNSDHEMDNKIEIKEEPWWLETETSVACDDKDEDFPPETCSRLCTEGISSVITGRSPLIAAEVSGRETSFYPEYECRKSVLIEMPTAEEHVLSEQSGKCSEGEEMCIRPLHLKQKNLIHRIARAHMCKFCDKNFTRLSHLKRHYLVHEGKKPHPCKTCDKSFSQSSYLKKHYLFHEGKKPHQCKLCDKSFTQTSDLNRHNLSHEGKKQYQCKICDKGFIRLSNLKRHYLIHEGKRLYQCKTCDKSFTRSSSLNVHNLIHDGKKPYQCKTCDKRCTRSSDLKRHCLIHESKK